MRNRGKPETSQIRITIDTRVLDERSKMAKEKGMTLSAYIEDLMRRDEKS